jgi:hypothetical protein
MVAMTNGNGDEARQLGGLLAFLLGLNLLVLLDDRSRALGFLGQVLGSECSKCVGRRRIVAFPSHPEIIFRLETAV